jgi:RNA polymerase sigma-B factor
MSTLVARHAAAPDALPRPLTRDERTRRTADLLATAAAAAQDERRVLLEEVVLLHCDVAAAIARHYRGRGIAQEDLRQVAYEGLVKAARRFDPSLGYDFMSYAVPTMRGEIRRYFRDQGWTVRPPRRIQELQTRLHQVQECLSQELGREPRRSEITTALRLTDERVDEVDDALQASGAFTAVSLDQSLADDEHRCVVDRLSAGDPQFAATEARLVLVPLVSELSARDRRILYLRYCQGLTQAEIGAEIGVTQMQVSRLLARILGQLRARLARP